MDFEIDGKVLKKAYGYDAVAAVPDGVEEIGPGVFSSFAYLEEIKLPSGLRKICDHSFNNCLELKKIVLPDSVRDIGEYAFQYCERLESICLPEGMETVESCAFRYCRRLKRMRLPESVKSVDYDAFFGCEDLESFCVPNPDCSFGRRVFYGCKSLKHLDAPYPALERLDTEQLSRAALAFCREPEGYFMHSRNAYDEALKGMPYEFMRLVAEEDDTRALGYLTEKKLISKSAAPVFLEVLRTRGAFKCVSAMLEYINASKGSIEGSMDELIL